MRRIASQPNEAGSDAGGYPACCLGCSLSLGGALLTCSHCPTADGARYLSTYETARCPAPAQLDNNNGHLVCSGLRNAPNLPAGGYADSCQGCAVDEAGEQLFCSHCSVEIAVSSVEIAELRSVVSRVAS